MGSRKVVAKTHEWMRDSKLSEEKGRIYYQALKQVIHAHISSSPFRLLTQILLLPLVVLQVCPKTGKNLIYTLGDPVYISKNPDVS
jgi:hypothetical protein